VPPSKYPFHELPNVILSPHVAGFTPEAAARNIDATVENIRNFLETDRPTWEVDLKTMY
jgi:phosphoglycerate dehydrogenase-like enzyme